MEDSVDTFNAQQKDAMTETSISVLLGDKSWRQSQADAHIQFQRNSAAELLLTPDLQALGSEVHVVIVANLRRSRAVLYDLDLLPSR